MSKRLLRLAVIGTVAGAFSGLFGIGGGTVLAAIVIIAALGAILHGVFGNVDVSKGVLIGIPAVFGVLVGTALQQRLPVRVLNGLFAILMIVSAALLVF
jgi:uncharacterized protein